MHDHYDHNQTLVPESFLALHSRHGRPLRPRPEIEARHELCEDVALHVAALLAERHQDDDDSGAALRRCHDGLRADPDAFAAAEAAWVVRRVAELQEWPQPAWLSHVEAGTASTGKSDRPRDPDTDTGGTSDVRRHPSGDA